MTGTEPRLVFRPEGKIDETNWQRFADDLVKALEQARREGRGLCVDFSAVPHMSSRGLRALTMAHKTAGSGVDLVLAVSSPRLREVFAISRYDKIFTVQDSIG